MVKVSPSIKFSYNLVKGSVESRRQFVSAINERVFSSTQPLFKDGKSHIYDLEDTFIAALPEEKRVEVIPLPKCNQKMFAAASEYAYDKNNTIVGQSIEMKTKYNKASENDFVLFIHEGTHVLDNLANPKYTSRWIKLDKKHNSWLEVLNGFEHDGSEENKKQLLDYVKKETLKFLKGKHASTKIDYLQDARYIMEREKHAYDEQFKYAQILQAQNKHVEEDDALNNSNLFSKAKE